ncbi:hypothetical protein NL676_008847 [Syzygium grande]|nr:hypothetical protein NL676_008847 [Syzygium grande]
MGQGRTVGGGSVVARPNRIGETGRETSGRWVRRGREGRSSGTDGRRGDAQAAGELVANQGGRAQGRGERALVGGMRREKESELFIMEERKSIFIWCPP